MTGPGPLVFAAWLAVLVASTGHERDADLEALAVRIRKGDHRAFRRFFDGTHADLLRSIRRRGLGPAAAEDAAQQAYVWLWEHRDRIDPERPLRGLLFRIGLRRALNHLRDVGRLDRLPETEPAGDVPGDPTALADLRRALAEAVAGLPERRRETFTLCFFDGLSHREAGEAMGVSPRTVEHQMASALAAIRAHLAPFLGDAGAQGAGSGTEPARSGAPRKESDGG